MRNYLKLNLICIMTISFFLLSCTYNKKKKTKAPFIWNGANVYFLLTDRFYNADKTNDVNFGRTESTAPLRGFMGGDIKGITKKINDGYFNKLGINAIWLSPIAEQIHGFVDEGTGKTYGFHGYWAKDWTKPEPNFGTKEDIKEFVRVAHKNGIRVLFDVVLNHTGPVTPLDKIYDKNWVRTSPQCTYKDYITTIKGPLVKNLPDIKTDSNENVRLPKVLIEKWKNEGRLDNELNELEQFFSRTGYPKAPKYYIIKWLTDYIKEYGIDGFRIDTAKHIEEEIWKELSKQSQYTFKQWKKENPNKVLDNNDFFLVGEVYNYSIDGLRYFDFGDKKVNYYAQGMQSLINFGFKYHANDDYEKIFAKYSNILNKQMKGLSVMNYISSHDDGYPFDQLRKKPFESANKLLLCPGISQVYYGDETARDLQYKGANGDANLRTFMNWNEIDSSKNGYKVSNVLEYWQKLGKFRKENPAIGAGIHNLISEKPYTFSRTYLSPNYKNKIIVAIDLNKEVNKLIVGSIFKDGNTIKDYFTGKSYTVKNNTISIKGKQKIALLAY